MSQHFKVLIHFLHKLLLFPTTLRRMDAPCSESESHKHLLLPPCLDSPVSEALWAFPLGFIPPVVSLFSVYSL